MIETVITVLKIAYYSAGLAIILTLLWAMK